MANTCTRSFSPPAPNGERAVTLDCQIAGPPTTLAYVVEETFPAGWSVANIGVTGPTAEGGLNDAGDLVTWAVLSGASALLTYTLTPPTPEAAGDFSGLLTAGTGTEFLYAVTGGETQIGAPATTTFAGPVPHPADNGFGDGIFEAPCEAGDFVLCFEEAMDYALHFRIGDDEYFPPWMDSPTTRLFYALVALMIWRVTDLKRYEDAGDPGVPRDHNDYAFLRWPSVPD